MKAIVFGGTGFIGSHAVEQLLLAGHEVTAAVRPSSDVSYLVELGARTVNVDFSDVESLADAMTGHDVAYNCTASNGANPPVDGPSSVEVGLTQRLLDAADGSGVSRFVQLSTIVLYDFQSEQPMDETYMTIPEYPAQRLALAREQVIQGFQSKRGMSTFILRPASTIGVRDRKSFFSRLLTAYIRHQFPMVDEGMAQVSLVDTRDIGRAMAWLGGLSIREGDNGVYVLKGYDTTWKQFKREIDKFYGRTEDVLHIPGHLSDEQLLQNGLSPFMVKSLARNRLWNDQKLRSTGFAPKYTLQESLAAAIGDLQARLPERYAVFPGQAR